MRAAVGLFAALLMQIGMATAAMAADDCAGDVFCEVDGNQNLDAIQGRVLIPAFGYEGEAGVRNEAATCAGCAWAITPSCDGNDEQTGNGCNKFVTVCPAPSLRYDILRRRPGEVGFTYVGSTCITPGAPLTVDAITPQVRDHFLDLLPDQDPSFQPAGGALVNVPALFAAGQPGTIGRDTFDLAGFRVEVTAGARWTWDFGDGTRSTYDKPGGPYPNQDVTHTYATSDDRTVVLTTTWEGTFLVDGLGPFAIGGPPVTQISPPIPLVVRGARSELVDGR